MNDSTRRGLRTAYQTIIGLVTALPLVIFALPADAQVTPVVVGVGVWIAVVSKAVNSLEDAGFIPAWLKG